MAPDAMDWISRPAHDPRAFALASLLGHAGHDVPEASIWGLSARLGFCLEHDGEHAGRITGLIGDLGQLASGLRTYSPYRFDTIPSSEALSDSRRALATTLDGDACVALPVAQDVLVARAHQGAPVTLTKDAFLERCGDDAQVFSGVDERFDTAQGQRAALRHVCAEMVRDDMPDRGYAALDKLRQDVEVWSKLGAPAAAPIFRRLEQSVRGPRTHGALGRVLMRDFVREVSASHPELARHHVTVGFKRVIDTWTAFARFADAVAGHMESDDLPGDGPVHHVLSMADAALQFEDGLWEMLARRLG